VVDGNPLHLVEKSRKLRSNMMKKSSIVLALAASMLVLVGCASKVAPTDQPVAAQDTPAAHHDYKGEIK
jgi:hypothetical protein